jgi:hypothetical protein
MIEAPVWVKAGKAGVLDRRRIMNELINENVRQLPNFASSAAFLMSTSRQQHHSVHQATASYPKVHDHSWIAGDEILLERGVPAAKKQNQ